MKKGDFIWSAIFIAFCIVLINPATRDIFISFTSTYKLTGGFLKFAILASMGELLAIRVSKGDWEKPPYFVVRAIIWGLIGMLITCVFTIFSAGILKLQEIHILPFEGVPLAFAFFVATFMNCLFAPTFMFAHRITDTYLDMKGEKAEQIDIISVIKRIDMVNFVTFVVGKTVPFFWIPAHTITFLLPEAYRILAAAFLSIALGLLLASAKRRKAVA